MKRSIAGQPAARLYAVVLLAFMFLAATLLRDSPHYWLIVRVTAIIAGGLACVDGGAAAVLLSGMPMLDSHWRGYQLLLPALTMAGVVYRSRANFKGAWHVPARTLLDLSVTLFAIAALVSVPGSVDQSVSLHAFVRVIALVIGYVALSRLLLDSSILKVMLWTIAAAGTYSSLIAFDQAFRSKPLVPTIESFATGMAFPAFRVSGFFDNPNTFAVAMTLSVLACFKLAIDAPRPPLKLLYAAGTLASLAAIGLSHSRAGYIGIIAGMSVLLWTHRPRIRFGPAMAPLAGCVVLVLWQGGVAQRALTLADYASDPSSMDRIYLSEVSLRMFADRPLFGVGLASMPQAFSRYYDPRVTVEVTDGHQMPFSIPAETGLLGLAAELAVAVAFVTAISRTRRKRGQGLAAIGPALVASLLAISFFNTLTYMQSFWIGLAVLGTQALRDKRTPTTEAGCAEDLFARDSSPHDDGPFRNQEHTQSSRGHARG